MGFYIIRHTRATMIGSSSKDFREVQAALGQITIQQQEVYRHDRALKAQQALIPPKEFRDKLSSPFIETVVPISGRAEELFSKALMNRPSIWDWQVTGLVVVGQLYGFGRR